MKRNVIPSIVKIIIILILGWVSIENLAFDLVSVITDISVTQQEELLCQEYEQMDFSQYATLIGFGVNRRLLSRSIGSRYAYKIDQEKVEMYCVKELKKSNWDFYKIRKQGDDRKTIIFQKEKFYCLLNFDRKNQFTVNLYYKDMDRRIRGI
ncbi:MAG: hypothetical protein ACRC76_07640 [Proteocatella sp.]